MRISRRRHTRAAAAVLQRRRTAAVLRRCLAIALLGWMAVALLITPVTWARKAQRRHRLRAGRTFYVAPNGNDLAGGTSPQNAWRTVGRVDHAQLRPGDTVLFEGDQTFADNALMPGDGFLVSGTARHPITFGSYGSGRASLPAGIWLGTDAAHPSGPSHLTFENLALGPQAGFQGTGDYITVTGTQIGDLLSGSEAEVGIITEGSHWVLSHNYIARTGDSGMLLGSSAGWAGAPPGGTDYRVIDNVIEATGLNPALGYGSHGIYDKVTDATIEGNRIIDFRNDGVSARYRGAKVIGNYISDGGIGIAWYQYDRRPGTQRFVDNKIVDTTAAGIFVCGVAESCWQPLGHFVIEHNKLVDAHGSVLNLQPILGRYTISSNR